MIVIAKGKYHKWLESDNLLKLEAWARDGLIDDQIAHNMGINPATLYDWKNKYSKISNALKKGKEVVDIEVENALLKRALGYTYEEITQEEKYNSDSKQYELRTTKIITKNMPPDTTAQIYWLKNRKPAKWREKPVDTEGNSNTIADNVNELNKAVIENVLENRNIEDFE